MLITSVLGLSLPNKKKDKKLEIAKMVKFQRHGKRTVHCDVPRPLSGTMGK